MVNVGQPSPGQPNQTFADLPPDPFRIRVGEAMTGLGIGLLA
jgi:hypothetical protein